MNRFRLSALLCLIALPLCTLAAEELVRVEVLLFMHSNGQSDAWPVDRLEDFSALPDPRQRALLAAWTARYRDSTDIDIDETEPGAEYRREPERSDRFGSEAAELQNPGADPGLDTGQTDAGQRAAILALDGDQSGPVWPETFVHDARLSSTMRRAFDRLNNSPAYEVLSVTGWLQPLDRRSPAPAVRVRDDSPVSIAWLSPTPIPYAIAPELNAPDLLPPGIFRLDGSVRIRQRQFRHAELNLVWSERSGSEQATVMAIGPDEFKIHRLRQNRPIQLGRLEYFDSPLIGALILVEAWQPSEQSAPGGR